MEKILSGGERAEEAQRSKCTTRPVLKVLRSSNLSGWVLQWHFQE